MKLLERWFPSWDDLIAPTGTRRDAVDLFIVSLLILFLELLFIRWISSEVRIVAYFKNMVIVACFLGLGLGCAMRHIRLGPGWSLVSLLLLVLLVKPPLETSEALTRMFSNALATFYDSPIWPGAGLPFTSMLHPTFLLFRVVSLLYVLVMFLLVVAAFLPLGQALGRLMGSLENPVRAYSLNVLASLLGIWAFAGMAWAGFPPWVWFLAVVLLFALLLRGGRIPFSVGLGVGLGSMAIVSLVTLRGADAEFWSPYHKLNLREAFFRLPDGKEVQMGHSLAVNETYYQHTINLGEEFLKKYPAVFGRVDRGYDQYSLPYRFVGRADDVLIVGAGMGNDVAAALRNGAERIDAVEIDPVIQMLGKKHHLERPYDSPKVHVVIDDARAYFKKTRRQYDLIVFGLLDSHTLSSEFSNIRLDHYVYTKESLEEARRLLKPGGVVALSFEVQRPWIAQRVKGLIASVFGGPPVAFHVQGTGHSGIGGTLFVGGSTESLLRIVERDRKLARIVSEGSVRVSGNVPLTTDDWPYLYLEKRTIPSLNLAFLGVILALSAASYRGTVGQIRRIRWDFFFLGAGFMLVEVQAISKLALLYGTTWVVNVVVISAILLMILLANLCVLRTGSMRLLPWFLGIYASLIGAYLVPTAWFLGFGLVPRSLLSAGLLSLPIFFAGFIFATLFRRLKGDPEGTRVAFGSNLLGAVLGGMSEALSYVWGMRSLLLVALGFYVLAWFLYRLKGQGGLLEGEAQSSL